MDGATSVLGGGLECLRICVPRRQLWPAVHPCRRTRRRKERRAAVVAEEPEQEGVTRRRGERGDRKNIGQKGKGIRSLNFPIRTTHFLSPRSPRLRVTFPSLVPPAQAFRSSPP